MGFYTTDMMINRVISILGVIFLASTNGDIGTEELKKELAALRSDVNQAALRSDVNKELNTLRSEVLVLSKQISAFTNELEDKEIWINQLSEQVIAATNQINDKQIQATQQVSAATNRRHTINSLIENVKSSEKTDQLPGEIV